METKVLNRKKNGHAALKPKVSDSSFEEDWASRISGEEVVKRVHKHIEELYASRKK